MDLLKHIANGGKIKPGDKIIIIEPITNGAGMVTAKVGETGTLQTDVISGDRVRIKLKGHYYAINYAPTKSIKLNV